MKKNQITRRKKSTSALWKSQGLLTSVLSYPKSTSNLKEQIISLLQEFKDCFAWNYNEMPGLDRGLLEHCLPIRPEFHHFQQPSRRMSKEVELKVKKEIERLLKAKFIRPTRYVQWLANIVPMMKKNEKLRIFVDFKYLNVVTD